jgi:hypothetical protein
MRSRLGLTGMARHNPPLERTAATVYFVWGRVARAPPQPLNDRSYVIIPLASWLS